MSKIMLLGEILDQAFGPGEHCLFGKSELITVAGEKYDLYFHSLEGINPINLKWNKLLMAPVLQHRYPEQEREAKLEMANLYKRKCLETFALRDKEVKIATIQNQKVDVVGRFLKFYQTTDGRTGIEVNSVGDYMITSKELLKKYVPNWRELKQCIDGLKSEIEREYSR